MGLRGSEQPFNDLCRNFNLQKCKSGAWNPQANFILESIHQVLGNCLRTFGLEKRGLDEDDQWEEFLTVTAYAFRSTVHTTLRATLGSWYLART